MRGIKERLLKRKLKNQMSLFGGLRADRELELEKPQLRVQVHGLQFFDRDLHFSMQCNLPMIRVQRNLQIFDQVGFIVRRQLFINEILRHVDAGDSVCRDDVAPAPTH